MQLSCHLLKLLLNGSYAITETEAVVDVLAVRKRPPYDYGDLESLLADYPSE